MSAAEWIALLAGVWFVVAAVTTLLVGPHLATRSQDYPAPEKRDESEEP